MIQRFVKTILLFLLILFTTSFCQVRDLDSAYFNKSTIELKSILDDWAERSKPLDKTIIDKKPLFERYAYELIEENFMTNGIFEASKEEFKDSTYQNDKFVFVPDEQQINFYTNTDFNKRFDEPVNDLSRKNNLDSTANILNGGNKARFSETAPWPVTILYVKYIRPRICLSNSKLIYYTAEINLIKKSFLEVSLNWNKYGTPEYEKVREEITKKEIFLSPYIKVAHAFASSGFIKTLTNITISFNTDLTKADVETITFHYGVNTCYERKNNKWVIKHSYNFMRLY